MKVSFVLMNPEISGGNRVLFAVANRLYKRGYDIELFANKPQKWFDLKPPIIVYRDFGELMQKIPESDVVTATFCWTAYPVDAVKGRKGIPAYYCQHYEKYFFMDPEHQKKATDTYDLPLNLIANSPWLQKTLKDLHGRDSFLVVPGVDTNVFYPRGVERGEESFDVLAFTSGTVFKGLYDTTLPALHHLSRYVKNLKVHFFGNRNLKIPYSFNYVHHGFLSDGELAELYSGCDLYVGGSWAESSPLPPLEAMACGCPVVNTNVGADHYGDAIKYVIPRAPRRLGDEMLWLVRHPEGLAEMRKRGLEAVKGFGWDKTADRAEAFFRELTG